MLRTEAPESLKVDWWTYSAPPSSWMMPQEVQTSAPGVWIRLRREGQQHREEREWEPAGGERPLGGAAEEEPGLGENRVRLVGRRGVERGREVHGAVERGGIVEAGEVREG